VLKSVDFESNGGFISVQFLYALLSSRYLLSFTLGINCLLGYLSSLLETAEPRLLRCGWFGGCNFEIPHTNI